MSFLVKLLSERGNAPRQWEVNTLARNLCEAIRGAGMLVTKETVFEALEAMARGRFPPTEYFESFSRLPEHYCRAAIIMLGEILHFIEFDTDVPWAIQTE